MDAVTHTEAQRRWYATGIIVAFLGVFLSGYSTYHHILLKRTGKTGAICNINAQLSCDTVASSMYSEWFGIPLGVIGLGFFLSCIVLLLTGLLRHKSSRENIPAYVLAVGGGLIISVGLGAISSFIIKSWCVTCLAIYAVCFAQAAIVAVYRNELKYFTFNSKNLTSGLTTIVAVFAVVIVIWNFTGPQASLPRNMQDLPEKDIQSQINVLPTVYDLKVSKSAYSGFGEDYRKGSDQAKVTFVEFADFQCPSCSQMPAITGELRKTFGDKLLIVFKNFPLDNSCNTKMQAAVHQYACTIAKMGRCAGLYGKFWQFHDLAFANQRTASPEEADRWAKEVGLTQEQITACKASNDLMAKVKDDIEVGNASGVDGTPSIYINDHKYVGSRDLDSMRRYIESLM